jgi:DNA-binding CsgD family transcriptional regulator
VIPLRDKFGERRGGVSIGGEVFPYRDQELDPIVKLCTEFLEEIDRLINETPLTLPELSKQEREVLLCAARGESIQDTSRILHISESAVKDAQSRARRKLKAKNTTHACTIAAQIKLI